MKEDETTVGDEELLAAFLNGDGKAYGALYIRYWDIIKKKHCQFVSSDEADDLTAETLSRVFEYAEQFLRDRGSFRTWAYRIARNVRIDCWRRTKHKPLHLPLSDIGEMPANVNTVDTSMSRLADTLFARQCITLLPLMLREVAELKWLDELSTSEIAELLKIPEGTVSSRLHSAMEAMRRQSL